MPRYDYRCLQCGHEFEATHSISAPPLTVCPESACPHKPWGQGKVQRGIGGGAGLIFKGSGFYITDYRSEGYKSAAKKDSEAGKAPAAKPESKPEAKPAAKPAPAAT